MGRIFVGMNFMSGAPLFFSGMIFMEQLLAIRNFAS